MIVIFIFVFNIIVLFVDVRWIVWVFVKVLFGYVIIIYNGMFIVFFVIDDKRYGDFGVVGLFWVEFSFVVVFEVMVKVKFRMCGVDFGYDGL